MLLGSAGVKAIKAQSVLKVSGERTQIEKRGKTLWHKHMEGLAYLYYHFNVKAHGFSDFKAIGKYIKGYAY